MAREIILATSFLVASLHIALGEHGLQLGFRVVAHCLCGTWRPAGGALGRATRPVRLQIQRPAMATLHDALTCIKTSLEFLLRGLACTSVWLEWIGLLHDFGLFRGTSWMLCPEHLVLILVLSTLGGRLSPLVGHQLKPTLNCQSLVKHTHSTLVLDTPLAL